MGKVISSASMSLDGFVAHSDDTPGRLFDWYNNGEVDVTTAHEDLAFELTPQSAEYWRGWTAGLGVLVVIAFVSLVGAGGRVRELPGDKVGLYRGDGPAAIVILAGRCAEQRVLSVELAGPEGPRWRVTSAKGTIARRFVVGTALPVGVVEELPFAPPPPEQVVARVRFLEDDGSVTTDEAAGHGTRLRPPWTVILADVLGDRVGERIVTDRQGGQQAGWGA